MSPGCSSLQDGDAESSMSSPSWPRTPISPANNPNQRPVCSSAGSNTPHPYSGTPSSMPPGGPPPHLRHPGVPVPGPQGMMPPQGMPPGPQPFAPPQGYPMQHPHMMQGYPHPQMAQHPPPHMPASGGSTPTPSGGGGSSREAGPALVARLMGDQQNMSPQEWRDREAFYTRLVNFASQHGHPLTGQPTVSKTPMDLYQLYLEVKRRGGFEEVTKAKKWKEVGQTVANLPQNSSSASYQLRNHYKRYLLPYECAFDRGGVDMQEVIGRCETKRQKKTPPAAQTQPAVQAPVPNVGVMTPPQQGMVPMQVPTPPSSMLPPGPTPPQVPSPQVQPGMSQAVMSPASQGQGRRTPVQKGPATPVQQPNAAQQGSQAFAHHEGYSPSGPPGYPHEPHGPMPPHMGSPRPPPGHYAYPGYPPQGPQGAPRPLQPPVPSVPQPQPTVPVPQPSSTSDSDLVARDPFDDRGRPPVYTAPSGMYRPPGPVPGPEYYQRYPGPVPPSSQPPPTPVPASNSAPTPAVSAPPVPVSASVSTAPASTERPTPRPEGPPPEKYSVAGQPERFGVDQQAEIQRAAHPTPYSEAFPPPPQPQPQQVSQPPVVPVPQAPPTQSAAQQLPPSGFGITPTPRMIHNVPPMPHYQPHPYGPPGPAQGEQPPVYPPPGPHQLPRPHRPPVMQAKIVAPPPWAASHFQHHAMQGGPPVVSAQMPQPVPSHPHVVKHLPYGGPKPYSQSAGHHDHGRRGDMAAHALAQVTFPPHSIEMKQPAMARRPKITYKDIGNVDAWRVVMALKSGLLAEGAWALNLLTVLLYDDSTVPFFGLQHLCGLLNELVKYYRVSLEDIFGKEAFERNEDSSGEDSEPEPSPSEVKTDPGEGSTRVPIAPTPFLPPRIATNRKKAKFVEKSTRRARTLPIIALKSDPDILDLTDNLPTSPVRLNRHDRKRPLSTATPTHGHSDAYGLTDKKSTELSEPGVKRNCLATHVNCVIPPKKQLISTGADASAPPSPGKTPRAKFFYQATGGREAPGAVRAKPGGDLSLSEEIRAKGNIPLNVLSDRMQESLARCRCISNIIRGFSFINLNDKILAQCPDLLWLLGKILLLNHTHVTPFTPRRRLSPDPPPSQSSSAQNAPSIKLEDDTWWWEGLDALRDDALVVLCNVSASLDLHAHIPAVAWTLCDSLLHWVVCPSSYAVDPLETGLQSSHPPLAGGPVGDLSPERYCLEILTKLSVLDGNVDLILATPPYGRQERLIDRLVGKFSPHVENPVREFSLVLLSALASGSEISATYMALETSVIDLLVAFLETADTNMHQVVVQQGMQALRENPELMGTSVGMLRRAANTLNVIAKMKECRARFSRHQQRLLNITMSQLMDSRVAATIAEVLFEFQKDVNALEPEIPSPDTDEKSTPDADEKTNPDADEKTNPDRDEKSDPGPEKMETDAEVKQEAEEKSEKTETMKLEPVSPPEGEACKEIE